MNRSGFSRDHFSFDVDNNSILSAHTWYECIVYKTIQCMHMVEFESFWLRDMRIFALRMSIQLFGSVHLTWVFGWTFSIFIPVQYRQFHLRAGTCVNIWTNSCVSWPCILYIKMCSAHERRKGCWKMVQANHLSCTSSTFYHEIVALKFFY